MLLELRNSKFPKNPLRTALRTVLIYTPLFTKHHISIFSFIRILLLVFNYDLLYCNKDHIAKCNNKETFNIWIPGIAD